MNIQLPFSVLILIIAFGPVNAVLFTAALPDIAQYFTISTKTAQQTISWFLIGYTAGQFIYAPLANRFGRKKALYLGVGLQILGSFVCVFAGLAQEYTLLTLGRFILALGAAVGPSMIVTLINDCYDSKTAAKKVSYLMLIFAFMPGISVALGGVLNTYYGWISCFYAGTIYGVVLLLLLPRLPETLKTVDKNALNIKYVLQAYNTQFKNFRLVTAGLLLGITTCFVYIFAALAPFIAINTLGMNSEQYGLSNLLLPIGLLLGSFLSAKLAETHSLGFTIKTGIFIATIGSFLMLAAVFLKASALLFLFFPIVIIYLGTTLLVINVPIIAMNSTTDKANGSAIMTFLNTGLATFVVLKLHILPTDAVFLPLIYIALCALMIGLYRWGIK